MFWNKKVKDDAVLVRLDALSSILADLSARQAAAEARYDELSDKLTIVNTEKAAAEASEPLVSLTGSDIDGDGKVKIELDWNDEFIAQLRASGYQGTTDEVVVQKWLVHLANDINAKLTNNNEQYS